MENLSRLEYDSSIFLIDFEPMQARFAQERAKMPSEERFEKMYGSTKNYQKPRYEVKTYAELRQAVMQIASGEMNQDLYSTPNGLYRERIRVAQSLRDKKRPVNVKKLILAGYEELFQTTNQGRKARHLE